MSGVKRILIVKLSAIGDVVHALPVAAALKRTYPHLEIDWVVERLATPIVEGSPILTNVYSIPRHKRIRRFLPKALRTAVDAVEDLRGRKYDVALDLQGLSKSALLARFSGARWCYGYNWLREIAPYLVQPIPREPTSLHVVDQLLDVARFLGADSSRVEFPIHIPDEADTYARETLASAGVDPSRPFLAVNPTEGGGTGQKGWGAERLAQLLDRLEEIHGLPAALVGAPGDKPIAQAICSATRRPPADLVGRTDLKQLAAVIRLATVQISGDTGSSHIAAAVGTPPVVMFGRSNPVRVGPYGYERFAVHGRDHCCEKCKHIHETEDINSTAKCHQPPPQCLGAVTLDAVADAVARAIRERLG